MVDHTKTPVFAETPAEPQDQTFLLQLMVEAKKLSIARDDALQKIRAEQQEIQDPLDDYRQMV